MSLEEWQEYESDDILDDQLMNFLDPARFDLPVPAAEDNVEEFLIEDSDKMKTVEWFLNPNYYIQETFKEPLVDLLNQMFIVTPVADQQQQGVVRDGRHYESSRYLLTAPIKFGQNPNDTVEAYWDHADPENLILLHLLIFGDSSYSISRQDHIFIEEVGHGENIDPSEAFLVMLTYWRNLYNWVINNEYFVTHRRSLHMQVVFHTEGRRHDYLSTRNFNVKLTEVDGETTLSYFDFLTQILERIRAMEGNFWQQYAQFEGVPFVIRQVTVNAVFSRRVNDLALVAGCQGLETNTDGRRLLHNDLRKRKNFIYDPPSIDNNCVFACIIKFKPNNPVVHHASTLDAETSCINGPAYLRTYCDINHRGPLSIEDIRAVSRRLRVGFQIYAYKSVTGAKYNQMLALTETIGVEFAEKIPLIICASHAYLLIPTRERGSANVGFQILKYRRCANCSKWFVFRSDGASNHFDDCTRCGSCGQNYQSRNGHTCTVKVDDSYKGMKIVKKRKPDDKATFDKNIYLADYETFTDPSGRCFVYAACVKKLGEDTTHTFYGQNASHDFAVFISKLKGTLVFYNGSNFDNLFLLTALLKIGCKVTKLIKKGSQLMQMETASLKVWDLCLFTKCSLSKACESYKVPSHLYKTSFNHKKVTNYETAETHRSESEKYCRQDVLALEAVYLAFATKMWELFSINVIDCITLSQYAFEYWRTTLEEQKIVLPTLEDYEFMRRGLYGGRCGPQYTHFNSDEYIEIMRQYHKTGKVDDRTFAALQDVLRFFDVCSLYPSRMKFEEYPLGAYNYLSVEECATLMHDLNNLNTTWIGFAEVDVECPDTLITPFLMARGDKGALIQDLLPKWNQVYPSSELYEAVRLGYKIKRIHKAINFESRGNPFEKFIDKIFALKAAAAVEPKDPVQYEIAKVCVTPISVTATRRS